MTEPENAEARVRIPDGLRRVPGHITVASTGIHGPVIQYVPEPTPAEIAARKQERERQQAAQEELHRTHLAQHDQVIDELRARAEYIAESIAEMHRPQRGEYPVDASECRGCDAFGYEVDETTWPCSTYGAIADALDITLEAKP